MQQGLEGSSPLTRGKLARHGQASDGVRLIPAHAGKTVAHWYVGCASRAHPRSRGENFKFRVPDLRGRGSSPLTRGKLRDRVGGGPGDGLIPAHAGKTAHERVRASRVRAHPRSRGENTS